MSGAPVPGLLLVFSAGAPRFSALPLPRDDLVLGRGGPEALALDDDWLSRRHVLIRFDGHYTITDLGSRNGTFVDGVRISEPHKTPAPATLCIGESVFVFTSDVRPFLGQTIDPRGDPIVGPTLRQALAPLTDAARAGRIAHIVGERGTGKQHAARAFHDASPTPTGPFVTARCATLTETLAAKRLASAPGGTLFLDELADLAPALQVSLARTLATLAAATPDAAATFRVCSSTSHDVAALVREGKLLETLGRRLAAPRFDIPPLRERREEIPFLLKRELDVSAPGLPMSAAFVDECLRRRWPGNVRELFADARAAGRLAAVAGSNAISAKHLPRPANAYPTIPHTRSQ